MSRRIIFSLMLSLVPGLAHLYLGRYKKALGLLVVSGGVMLGLVFSSAIIIKLLMGLIYLTTAIPSTLEAYQISTTGSAVSFTNQRWYIVLLLLVTGFSALPLLWQSDQFTRSWKVAWTVAVPLLAVLFFTVLGVYWQRIEHVLEGLV